MGAGPPVRAAPWLSAPRFLCALGQAYELPDEVRGRLQPEAAPPDSTQTLFGTTGKRLRRATRRPQTRFGSWFTAHAPNRT